MGERLGWLKRTGVLATLRTCRGKLVIRVSGLGGWVLRRAGPLSVGARSVARTVYGRGHVRE